MNLFKLPGSPRRAAAGTVALLAAAIMAMILWPHEPPGVSELGPSPSVVQRTAAFKAAWLLALPARGDLPDKVNSRAEPTPADVMPSVRLPRSTHLTFDEVDDPRLFGLSPEMLSFVDIQHKALRSREDFVKALSFASDPRLLDDAVEELSHHEPSEQQALARRRRIALVDFLVFALANSQQPRRVAQAIREIITYGDTAEGEPLEIQKTFAGDRIELALALERYDPDEFEALRAQVAGSQRERIVEYAASLEHGHASE